MKRLPLWNRCLYCALSILLLFSSCDPDIKTMSSETSTFCPCGSIGITYQVNGADAASITVDPASSLQPGTSIPVLVTNDARDHSLFLSLCGSSDVTVTIHASNSHGRKDQSLTFHVQPETTISGSFTPMCRDARFGGEWDFNPPNTVPINSVIRQATMIADRPGTLSVVGVGSLTIHAGSNEIGFLADVPLYSGTMFFTAAARVDERCFDDGTVNSNGGVPPGTQSIRLVVGCPRNH